MTLTLALIVNAVLMAGVVAAVARMIHLPFRIERRRHPGHAVRVLREERDELSRAA